MRIQKVSIEELKGEIKKKRAEMETTHQYEVIREKEDELQNLKRIYNELKAEQTTMERIIAEQQKALGERRENEEESVRKQDMLNKLKEVKIDNRKLQEKVYGLEKEVKAQHNLNVKEKLEIREDNKFLEGNKGKRPEDMTKLSTEVEQLEAEINKLKQRKKEITEMNMDKFDEIEKIKKEKKKERDRLEQLYKEKDKFVRLNALKLNTAKRSKRYHHLKPLDMDNEDKAKENDLKPKEEEIKEEGNNLNEENNFEQPVAENKNKIASKPFVIKK